MSTRDDADEAAADPGGLRELSDPEFIALWGTLRSRLALTPAGSPGHAEIKSRYDAVKTEFRRRLDGGLAIGRNSSR